MEENMIPAVSLTRSSLSPDNPDPSCTVSVISEAATTNVVPDLISSSSKGKLAIGEEKMTPCKNPMVSSVEKHSKKMMSNLTRRPPVDIEFKQLKYSVSENMGIFNKSSTKKVILNQVSGQFKSGELVAIMGPSGAGKSTLMDIMAGYKTSNVDGDILINGKARNLRKFRKMSCYIMQDDFLCPHLTVAEAMEAAANLKLDEKTPDEQKNLLVQEIVQHIGLTECMDTKTSKISGGQRKRLAIALELINNPPVMFLDEPTSGLDSYSCSQCILLLKQLAREGRTIICTIHQPSAKIFEMFDKLYVMSEGSTIYRGSVKNLVPYLASLELFCPSYHNPADFILEIATGEYGNHNERLAKEVEMEIRDETPDDVQDTKEDEILDPSAPTCNGDVTIVIPNGIHPEKTNKKHEKCKLGVSEEDPQSSSLLGSLESVDEHCKTFPTSSWTQFKVLLVRTFKSLLRDDTLTKLRLLSHVLIGVLLGLLYWDIGNEGSKAYNNSAMLFFCMLFCMFTAMMPTVMTFPLEMATFKREHLNYWYSMKSYYLAKVMADLPFQIVFPFIYVIIVYFMTSQPLELPRFCMFTSMCILTSLVAQSLGLVIGCACDIQSAVYLGPITTIPILLFSGFFVSLNNIPTLMQWLSYVAYVRYGFEGTMLAIYSFDRAPLDCSQDYCHFKYPQKFLEELALDKGVFWVDAVILILFFVLLRVVGYFVLRWKVRSEK